MSGQNPYGQQMGYGGYGQQQMSYEQQQAMYQQQQMYAQQQQMGYQQQQQWGGGGGGGGYGQQGYGQQQQQYPGGFNPYGQQQPQQQQQQSYGQANSVAAQLAAGSAEAKGKGGKDRGKGGNSSSGGKDSGGKGGKNSSKGYGDDSQSMRSSNKGGGGGGGGQKKPANQELTLEEYQAQKKAEKAAREEKMKKQQAEARERMKREQEAGPPPGVEFLRPEMKEEASPKKEPEPKEEAAPEPKEEPKEEPKVTEEPADNWEDDDEAPAEEPAKVEEAPKEEPPPPEPVKEVPVAPKPAAPEPVKEEPPAEIEEEAEEEEEAGAEGKVKVDKTADLKEPDPRPHLNVVFIGHVDAGKSTTCGNILFLSGCVDDRTVEKYMKEAKDKNRESWFLAYIMDTNDEEKAKGKTVEVGRAHFETADRRFTILDAPGHKSYVPNMIAGASQADIAVLIISARKGEFETGFERGGQTREHALLAKTLGVEKLLITINKMDDHSVEWAQSRFDEIQGKLAPFLKTSGFKEDQVIFLPISGLTGDNIKEKKGTPDWFKGQTLLDTLNSTAISRPSKEASLRIPMLDGYRDMGNITAIGKVEQGSVKPGMKCIIMPIGQKCTIVNVCINDEMMKFANVGENVTLKVNGATEDQLTKGFVLCPVIDPIRIVTKFKAQLQVIELPEERPVMTSGYRSMLHVHVATEECEILKLYESMSMSDRKKKEKNPRFVREASVVTVSIQLARPTALDSFTGTPQLGRFTLRDEGRTIAIGKITELPKDKEK